MRDGRDVESTRNRRLVAVRQAAAAAWLMAIIRALRCASTACPSRIGSIPHTLQPLDFADKFGSNHPRQAKQRSDSPIPEQARSLDDRLFVGTDDLRKRRDLEVHADQDPIKSRWADPCRGSSPAWAASSAASVAVHRSARVPDLWPPTRHLQAGSGFGWQTAP